jgi:glycosyltransferase involved in cell wall biosynthesis
MSSDGSTPLVSVVVATYDRSNVLRLALESLRRQTFKDWEARVIGDACSDDTAEVIAALGDPRIHFENLPENFGEQSHPNNVGCRRARGRYIAFLNHDDLWFPDHLATSVEEIEKTGADLVFSAFARCQPRTREQLLAADWRFRIEGIPLGARYEPWCDVPASTWLLRRELVDELGGWRPAVEIWGAPSQDFLFRAWKARKRLLLSPHLTVLLLVSGIRRNSYAERQSFEQAFFLERMAQDPGFRERVLECAALRMAGRAGRALFEPKRDRLRSLLYRVALRLGWSPRAVDHWLAHGFRKRDFINARRRQRGLEEI